MPEPPLLTFAAHKAPHLIDLGFFYLVDNDLHLRRIKRLKQSFIGLLDERLFFFDGLDDRRGTDASDPGRIADPTAIERHIHDPLFHRRESALVLVL